MDPATYRRLSAACERIRSEWYIDINKAAAAVLSGEAMRLIEVEEKLAEFRANNPSEV